MRCRFCSYENDARSKFCQKCGTKLITSCPECSAEISNEDIFCSQCGLKLLSVEKQTPLKTVLTGELKQVTVLFSDLSGYTELSETLDPEETKEVMNLIFGAASQIISRYEGHIEKFIGDAVMALFGIPRVHEDDPVRAIKASREIHEYVEKLSPKYEKEIGKSLTMHSGINTGIVIADEEREDSATGKVLGDAINIASRLTSRAQPGQILTAEETYKLANRYFNFINKGFIKFKGIKEPVNTYIVAKEIEKPLTVHRLTGLRSELIGRARELEKLNDSISTLKKGKGSILAVCGEAGTGKSRLISDFKNSLDLSKLQWREGRSYEFSQNIPYYALTNLIGQAWKINMSDPADVILKKIDENIVRIFRDSKDISPYIGSLFGLRDPLVEKVSPEFWKTRIYELVKNILAAITSTGPTVIFLDDIHWADPSSLDLFRTLLFETRYQALFICIYRRNFNLFNEDEIKKLQYKFNEIVIKDLDVNNAHIMMESLLQTHVIPEKLKIFIQEKVDGNPFYLEEVINSLIESEALIRDNVSWKLTAPQKEIDVPLTINGLISARLDRLDADTKKILQEASVIGRTFPYEILYKITDDKSKLKTSLDLLEELDLIRRSDNKNELEYIFKHALTYEVVYKGLLKKGRCEIHEKIGQVMEDIYKDRLSDALETLAYHFKHGKSINKAIKYQIKSAEKSIKKYAVEESHKYFKQAFELIQQLPDDSEDKDLLIIDLIIKWALVYNYRGDYENLLDILISNAGLTERIIDNEKLGMYFAWLGQAYWGIGKFVEANDALSKALQIGEDNNLNLVIAYSCQWLTWVNAELGLLDDAINYGKRAQEISKEIKNDHFLYFNSTGGLGFAYWYKGDLAKAFEIGQMLMEYGKKHSNMRSMVMAQFSMGCGHFGEGDFSSAINCFKEAIDVSRDYYYTLFPKLFLGMGYVSNGQFEEAEKPLGEVYNFCKKYGNSTVGTPAQGMYGVVKIASGEMTKGIKMLREASDMFHKNKGIWRYAIAEYIEGNIYMQLMQNESKISLKVILRNLGFLARNIPFASRRAINHFNISAEMAKSIGAKGLLGQNYVNLGTIYAHKGKKEMACKFLEESIDLFEKCCATSYLNQAKNLYQEIQR